MISQWIDLRHRLLVFLIASVTTLCACGGETATPSSSDSGRLSFKITYSPNQNGPVEKAAAINCNETGVETIDAMILSADGTFLAGKSGWDCMTGRGTLTSVPVGSDLSMVIIGRNGNGNVVFRGQKSNIQVAVNQNTNIGTINCQTFIPRLMAPEHGAQVNGNTMGLAWFNVSGATRYRVIVSESQELNDPVINEMTDAETFTPTTLVDGRSYYWQVIALDRSDNPSSGSPVFEFTLDAAHANTPPQVSIVSPAHGAVFTTNDSLAMTGSGTDSEDGNLGDASLVWHSDIDGRLGTGQSVTVNTLSTGTHEITLTATDADGATANAKVVITVNPSDTNTSPVANITSPVQGTTYPNGQEITFEGSATDTQDGDLSGASLVWRSDLDGLIGNDRTFTLDTLSSGTHRITLTATDADGATGTDETVITIQAAKPIKVLFAIDCSGSMGADNVGTDPNNLRVSAALAFANHYNANPKIAFEIMLWNGSITDATRADGFRGFTKDPNEFQRVLNNVSNMGVTDYLVTLEGIRTDIQRDILDTEPHIRAQAKYIVLFLSDGLDNVPGQTEPRVDQVLAAVDDLYAMAVNDHKVGMFSFHTFYLSDARLPVQDRQASIALLQSMSEHGNGDLLREYDHADEISYINTVDMNW